MQAALSEPTVPSEHPDLMANPLTPVWSKMGYARASGTMESYLTHRRQDWRCGRKLGELPSLQPADCKCGSEEATVEDIGF